MKRPARIALVGFMGSGKNAHEQRMGQLLGQLRWQGLLVFFMVIALVATVVLHHPAHQDTAALVNRVLDGISTDPDNEDRSQAMVAAVLLVIAVIGKLVAARPKIAKLSLKRCSKPRCQERLVCASSSGPPCGKLKF